MNLFKILLSMFCIITTISSFASTNLDVVSMKNATNCHVAANGHYSMGHSVAVGTYSTPAGGYYSIIYPSQSANMPILHDKSNAQLYAIVDNAEASDAWGVTYIPGDKYILSYDGETNGCNPRMYQCLVFSSFNPCS